MSLASEIVQQGYREGNIIPVGTAPTSAQLTEGLGRLSRLIVGLFDHEMGEQLSDWLVPSPQRTAPVAANFPQFPRAADLASDQWPYPPRNSRIVFADDVATTVYFPEAPDDGTRMGALQGATGPDGVVLTLDGNGRSIQSAPTLDLTTPLTALRWLYRADLGDWRLIGSLALSDEMPFSADLDEFFILFLAVRLAPTVDKTLSQATVDAYKLQRSRFLARYRQTGVTTFGSDNAPRSLQSYTSGAWEWL